MNYKKYSNKIISLSLLFILIVLLTPVIYSNGEVSYDSKDYNLRSYFPLNPSMQFSFKGEGIEYASFKRNIMYVDNEYLQLTDDNGGTVVVKIYKVTDEKIIELYSEGEFYEEKNLIPEIEGNKKGNIILKTPLEVGNKWESEEQKREIVLVKQIINVPAGAFHQVIKVKISYTESNNIGYEYFAPNIGLIKREYFGENFEVKSELETLHFNNRQ